MENFTKKQKSLMLLILDETVKYYGKDYAKRRSVDAIGCSCRYNGVKNTHCAVGRCLTKKWQTNNVLDSEAQGSIKSINWKFPIDTILKKKYRGLPVDFWQLLQTLHDNKENWEEGFWTSKKGLSAIGENNLNVIKFRFGINN